MKGDVVMYDKHLDAFIAVAEKGSFTAAAKELYISGSALIQQINCLESDLQLKLFIRSNKGVRLTAEGQYILDAAGKIINISRQVLDNCRALGQPSVLRIGVMPNFRSIVITKICNAYKKLYPETKLCFVEYPLSEYFQAFMDNKFDISTEYTAGYIFYNEEYTFLKLMEDRHCIGVPQGHKLAAKRVIKAHDLAGQKLLLYAKGITRADDHLRELLKSIPQLQLEDITAYDASITMCCEIEGALLLYYERYKDGFAPLRSVPLEDALDVPIDLGLGYRKKCRLEVHRFIELAQKLFLD